MNPYQNFVSQFANLLQQGEKLPLGTFPFPQRPPVPADAPKALIFSPHPDDEVIVGALPLRLLREMKVNVINVAVTQGSNKARQQGRWDELTNCCKYVGFGLVQTGPGGLEGINLKTRKTNPKQWVASVSRIMEILKEQRPGIIFFPHAGDWNSSHVGTHYVVADALDRLGSDFACTTVEVEYWAAMPNPNLMVESSEQDITDLITALTFHVGEVQRNPYHLRLPPWLIDNVRRGAEIVGGQGGTAPNYLFGTLYRVRRWEAGQFKNAWEGGKFLGKGENPETLFGRA